MYLFAALEWQVFSSWRHLRKRTSSVIIPVVVMHFEPCKHLDTLSNRRNSATYLYKELILLESSTWFSGVDLSLRVHHPRLLIFRRPDQMLRQQTCQKSGLLPKASSRCYLVFTWAARLEFALLVTWKLRLSPRPRALTLCTGQRKVQNKICSCPSLLSLSTTLNHHLPTLASRVRPFLAQHLASLMSTGTVCCRAEGVTILRLVFSSAKGWRRRRG